MIKSCCAVGCKNVFVSKRKGGKLLFYNFPADKDLRRKWIAAVKRENWTPNEYTTICRWFGTDATAQIPPESDDGASDGVSATDMQQQDDN